MVIHYTGWGCQSPDLWKIHCFKWEYCIWFALFKFVQHFQKHNASVKHDLFVVLTMQNVESWRHMYIRYKSHTSHLLSSTVAACLQNPGTSYQPFLLVVWNPVWNPLLLVEFSCHHNIWTYDFVKGKLKSLHFQYSVPSNPGPTSTPVPQVLYLLWLQVSIIFKKNMYKVVIYANQTTQSEHFHLLIWHCY